MLNNLTSAQREAVQHGEGPLLILAGPGSGKTRVVTHRVAYLLEQGVSARDVLALTFTNKAAGEMHERVQKLTGGEPVWMSTFHRFCSRLLRSYASMVGLQESFTIYDTHDSQKALERVLDDLDLDTVHYTPAKLAAAISREKNQLRSADEFRAKPGNPLDNILARVYPAYQKQLLASSAVDFDDLLLHVARLLRENQDVRRTLDARYRFILVDEYQDTNRPQFEIIRALSLDHPNLAVTGDPDQSIYGWRGATLKNILQFESQYPNARVVRLEQNWRSTKRILRVADSLINYNRNRKQKELYTDNDEGAPVRLVTYDTEREEADAIADFIIAAVDEGRRRPRDFAIFYRVNALSRTIETALRQRGIPYQMVNGLEFYQRKEIKDVLAYLHLINNPRDDVAFLRIVNTPPRGIGKKTIVRLKEHAARSGRTMLETARESGMIESLTARAATMVAKFVAIQDRLCEHAADPIEEILGHVLDESGYQEYLEKSGLEEDLDRLENVQELLSAARQVDEFHEGEGALEAFLEESSLVNDTDAWEVDTDKVTLMTLHAAKGLEFPVVYIVAAEDGLLPHERSRKEQHELEEERRLLFVGITRAEERLQLSRATYREFRGQRRMTVPSSFFFELPRDEMEVVQPASAFAPTTGYESAPRPRRERIVAPATVATAAEILNDAPAQKPTVSADEFHQGMAVTHPEYGLGKIVALSGSGPRRTGTVAFAIAGQKKFVLEKSALKPARRSR